MFWALYLPVLNLFYLLCSSIVYMTVTLFQQISEYKQNNRRSYYTKDWSWTHTVYKCSEHIKKDEKDTSWNYWQIIHVLAGIFVPLPYISPFSGDRSHLNDVNVSVKYIVCYVCNQRGRVLSSHFSLAPSLTTPDR